MDETEKDEVITSIINNLVEHDAVRLETMETRIPDFSGREEEYINDRKRIWEKRVLSILDNNT